MDATSEGATGAGSSAVDTPQQESAELRSLLAAIVSTSDDAIVSKGLDGVIRTWNQGAERLFGYSAAEAVGRPIDLIIPPELRHEEQSILERLGRGESIEHFDTVRVAKDGRRLDISLAISPIRDASGRVVGASKVARDVTERKRAEEALLEADRRKNEFLATLGHELRNPLAPMRSMLEVLRHGDLDPKSTRNAHEMMARQLDVVVRLVDDLLDLSRITQAKLQLRKERVDMAALVASAVGDIRESVAAARQELVVTQPDEPVAVVVDPVRIGQVLTNLLSNATKFTPEGGRIELVIEPGTDEVRILVRDDGLGIPPDKLDSVFEMFSQVGGSLENGRKGLGIGLSLVRSLVDLHDGRVEAASAGPGRGSEFRVWLPRGPVRETALETPREDAGPVVSDGSCRRVLIVDDNLDAARSLAMLVEILGHEVRLAADGIEAVEVASEFRPELVLLDIGLPGLSGYDVAQRIRDQEWGRGAVLAAVTGWGQETDRHLALQAGCDLHATKPLSLETLRAVLETVAQRAPAERGPR